jgi:hypothetical protein
MEEFYLSLLILTSIPILGAIKNIVKRKTFNILIFLRTFALYFMIYLILEYLFGYYFYFEFDNSMLICLLERWIMFVYKIIYSFVTKNYEKKKFKYYHKYLTELSSGSLDKMYHIDNFDKAKNL